MSSTLSDVRRDLTSLLVPQSVAIVGISQPGRFGGQLYQNIEAFGFEGAVYGINPRYESLYDKRCYASLRDLPETPDCALLAVPNSRLVPSLEEAAATGVKSVCIFANAYSDASEDPSLEAQLKEIALASEINLLGPNCMGFIAPVHRLPVSGYPVKPSTPAGNVTFISHSGSVWEGFVQNRNRIAYNYIISAGNELVITVADFMQFSLRDPNTRAIGLFLETVRDPETFLVALEEAAECDIPIVALKTGRSERGAQMAQAHSGALAGEDGAYEAVFRKYGVMRATSMDEMIDTLELLATGMRPRTTRVAALLDSGGQRALMVDLAESEGVEFAAINDETKAALDEVLEPGLTAENPLDAWGTGNDAGEIYAACLLALDSDPQTGMTLLAVDVCPEDDADCFYGEIVKSVQDQLMHPIACVGHLTSAQSDFQVDHLRKLGVPVLQGTETALRATRHVLSYAAFQRARQAAESRDGVREIPEPKELDSLRAQLAGATSALDEHASKQMLEAYGLTTTTELRTDNLSDTLRAGAEIGYPLVLKTCGGELHKTEHDGVRLGIANESELKTAYRDFEARLGPHVLVQEMIPAGAELILGVVNDPQFGPLLTIGTGGIFVEVLKDVTMLTLPTTSDTVERAVLGLRGAPLLLGARGRAPVDVKAVVRAAMGLAALGLDMADAVAEIDVNPLTALADRAVVVDALIIPKH